MRYKQLKNAGVKISELGVGTWALGGAGYGPVDHDQAIAAIHEMIDRGVNLVDTAPCYGNGMAEKMVGEALEGIRDKVLISSKFDLITDIYTKGYVKNASYQNCMREIGSTLMNLKTDHLDFYFVHWPDPKTPVAETMSALNWLKKEGYIRFIGVSNFSAEQMKEAEQYGQIDVIQPMYSMVERREEADETVLCGRHRFIYLWVHGRGHSVGPDPGAAALRRPRSAGHLLRLFRGAEVLEDSGTSEGDGPDRRGASGTGIPGCAELEHPEGIRGDGPGRRPFPEARG